MPGGSGSKRSAKMPGPAKIAVLAVCISGALHAQGRGALKPEVISHPKAESGFKSHSEWWVQVVPMDVVAELL